MGPYVPAWLALALLAASGASTSARSASPPPGRILISGCVVDTAGQPRASANIHLAGDYYGYSDLYDVTDDRGRFQIEVAAGSKARSASVTLFAYQRRGVQFGAAGRSEPVEVTNHGESVVLPRCLVMTGWQRVNAVMTAPDWDLHRSGVCTSGHCPIESVAVRLDCDARPCPLYARFQIRHAGSITDLSDGIYVAHLGEGMRYSLSIERPPGQVFYDCALTSPTTGVLSLDRDAEFGRPQRTLAELRCSLSPKGEEERRKRVAAKIEADAAYAAELDRQARNEAPQIVLPRRGGGDGTALLGDSAKFAQLSPQEQQAIKEQKQQQQASRQAALASNASKYMAGVVQQTAQAVQAPSSSPPPSSGAVPPAGERWVGTNGTTVYLTWKTNGFDSVSSSSSGTAWFAKIGADTYRFDEQQNYCIVRFLNPRRFEYSCNGSVLAHFDKAP